MVPLSDIPHKFYQAESDKNSLVYSHSGIYFEMLMAAFSATLKLKHTIYLSHRP